MRFLNNSDSNVPENLCDINANPMESSKGKVRLTEFYRVISPIEWFSKSQSDMSSLTNLSNDSQTFWSAFSWSKPGPDKKTEKLFV